MHFAEKQKFTQWWVWILLTLIALGCSWGAIQQLVFKIPFGTKPVSDEVLLLLCITPIIPIMLFTYLQLETEVDNLGVHFRFRPFHLKKKFIPWADIAQAYTREYKPVKEYGGWGIKISYKNGKAYNVSGNKGLQLVLTSGKKILLGTNKPEELEYALQQIFRKPN